MGSMGVMMEAEVTGEIMNVIGIVVQEEDVQEIMTHGFITMARSSLNRRGGPCVHPRYHLHAHKPHTSTHQPLTNTTKYGVLNTETKNPYHL